MKIHITIEAYSSDNVSMCLKEFQTHDFCHSVLGQKSGIICVFNNTIYAIIDSIRARGTRMNKRLDKKILAKIEIFGKILRKYFLVMAFIFENKILFVIFSFFCMKQSLVHLRLNCLKCCFNFMKRCLSSTDH